MGPARRLVRTAVAGAVLSGVPSGLACVFGYGEPVAATREIGRFWTGRPSILAGAVGHVAISTLLAVPAPVLARARVPALAGALYGAALYVLDFKLIAPRLWPELALRHGGAVQAADHLAFGIVVATSSKGSLRIVDESLR